MKDPITIDDFAKIDLRVGTIHEAEEVPGADRLLKLTVDVGDAAPRTILAGIKQHYTRPEGLLGRKIIVVCNLPPRTMKGVESHGMLLAAKDADTLSLLTLDQCLPSGTPVG